MDTSGTYIKMCKKAEEIQNQRPKVAGDHDYFYCPVHGLGCNLDKSVWLPRQDQLQEMMALIESPARVIWCVGCWCNHNKYAESFTSMEQLWLAFVMKERYRKIWDGEAWQKQ